MFAELAAIVAPIYLIVGLGYGWARAARHYDTSFVTDIVMTIGAPALVFARLSSLDMPVGPLVEMAGATVVALTCFFALGAVVLKLSGLSLPTYLGPVVFGNAGNMGLPLCYFAFGDEGLAYGICFFAVAAISHYTVGQWVWSGKPSMREVNTPLTWAVVAAVAVLAFDLPVPTFFARVTEVLGGLTIPLMQLSLGVSLATLSLTDLPRTFGLSALRLGMGALVGAGLAEAFGFSGVARGVLILDCAMPAAVFNFMMAERYGRAPSEAASVVVLSTLLSFVTLPLLLGWLGVAG